MLNSNILSLIWSGTAYFVVNYKHFPTWRARSTSELTNVCNPFLAPNHKLDAVGRLQFYTRRKVRSYPNGVPSLLHDAPPQVRPCHGATATLKSSCVQWTFQICCVVAFKTVAGHERLRGPTSKRTFINDTKCTSKIFCEYKVLLLIVIIICHGP